MCLRQPSGSSRSDKKGTKCYTLFIMNADHSSAKNMRHVLEKLRGVDAINEVRIKDKLIEYVAVESKLLGRLAIRRLDVEDSAALFDFYFQGLSRESRNYFPPYPLFSPPLNSMEELSSRITEWKKEDDWAFLNLAKDELIIGVCLLKRYQPKRPVSGLAVREQYQKMGLGVLLQTIVNEQARLSNLKKLYATIAPDNAASLRTHRTCGFKETGIVVPHVGYRNGIKEVDRLDIEMVIELNYRKTNS